MRTTMMAAVALAMAWGAAACAGDRGRCQGGSGRNEETGVCECPEGTEIRKSECVAVDDSGATTEDAGDVDAPRDSGEADGGNDDPDARADAGVDSGVDAAVDGGAVEDGGEDAGAGGDRAVEVVAGAGHTCALLETGAVQCWGGNNYGQLASGSAGEPILVPQTVAGVAASKIVSAAEAVCAIEKLDGAVKCWGGLNFDRYGGIVDPVTSPVATGVTGAVEIAMNDIDRCVVNGSGQVLCWQGYPGGAGYVAPVVVPGLSDVVAVAGGSLGFCALQRNGDVSCWGYWFATSGASPTVAVPSPVRRFTAAKSVSLGNSGNVCVVLTSGAVQCMGEGGYGQLGNGIADGSSRVGFTTPQNVLGFSTGVQVAVGMEFACALLDNGTNNCWGKKAALGSVTTEEANPTPQRVVDVSGATFIAAGTNHACAVVSGGAVKCWGGNNSGQLGDRTTIFAPTAVSVRGFGGN